MNVDLFGCKQACGPLEVVISPGTAPELELKGERERAVVSASGPVCRGEFVQRAAEYAAVGEPLRWGLEDVHILDAAELSQGRVGVVFAQGSATKFKVLALEGGELTLGNTLVLVEDEALEGAKLLELADGRVMALYNRDAAGMAAVITLDGRAAALAYTDLWDDEDPENIRACRLSKGRVLVSGMKQSRVHAGEAWARVVTPEASRLRVDTEARVDGGNDTDVYSGGWALAQTAEDSAVLVYPQAPDKPVGFAVLDVDSHNTVLTRLTAQGKYAASLPSVDAVGLDHGRWAMVYGVGWLSADKQVVKSTLALEVWGLTRYAAELIWYGCEDTRYAQGIGAVAAAPNGIGVAVSYTGEGEGRAMLLGLTEGPSPGPAVPLGGHGGFCRVVPISLRKALLVSQREGNGYVQAMEAVETVVPSGTLAHGVALSGGAPGETITISAVG